jgi:hypothetical protein
MDSERIKGLMELLAESDLLELSLTEGDTTVRLYKQAGTAQLVPPVVSERPPAAPRPKATAAVAGVKSSPASTAFCTSPRRPVSRPLSRSARKSRRGKPWPLSRR